MVLYGDREGQNWKGREKKYVYEREVKERMGN